MIWKTEHYKFVLTPKYVRTSSVEYENIICDYCNGQGERYIDPKDDQDGFWDQCSRCRKSGFIRTEVRIPKPPEMDKDFLEALKKFVEEYQ